MSEKKTCADCKHYVECGIYPPSSIRCETLAYEKWEQKQGDGT